VSKLRASSNLVVSDDVTAFSPETSAENVIFTEKRLWKDLMAALRELISFNVIYNAPSNIR